jgi:uncharacterized protein (TIGR04255 family)
MGEVRHLRNAPILEANVDFRVTMSKGFDVQAFRNLADVLPGYPTVEAWHRLQTSFTFREGRPEPPVSETGPGGYVYRSADAFSVAQFRIDGFTYSRLRPYTSWDDIYPEVIRLWGVYRRVGRPEACSRIGVRYINKIELPDGTVELNDYLIAPPRVPEGVPDSMTSFLTRIIVKDPEHDRFAIVGQSSQVELGAGPTSWILLDIDAFRTADGGLEARVEDTLEQLHDLKNRIFFGSVRDEIIKERYE